MSELIKLKKYSVILIIIVLLLSSYVFIRRNKKTIIQPSSTISVAATKAIVKATPIEWKTLGNIEPDHSVAVMSQVSGILKKIDFTPGESVKAGQLLFEIDPEPFKAKLIQAKQSFFKDQAQLQNTLKNKQRLSTLIKKGYISKQDYDQIIANSTMQEAVVKSDKQSIKEAQIQLNYTKIKAPLTGKTGNVPFKVGDLITAENGQPLVTINQLNPVLVNFNLPQQKLSTLLSYQHLNPIIIEVINESGDKVLGKGKLTFIDNTINSKTGTVLLKGTIDNSKELLWPLQMVKVKLILTIEKNALVIPSQAVKMDEKGPFIYTIINGKAIVKRIKVNRQVGQFSVIEYGLKPGNIVITLSPPEMQNGTAVKIVSSNFKNKNLL